MIIMNVKLDNIFSFNEFHMNMSYPKKIINSGIENEYLSDRPNFRYKRVVILMGANATGKTTLGKALMRIFNFISRKNIDSVAECIHDKSKQASFSIDFVANSKRLYRVETVILPTSIQSYKEEHIRVVVKSRPIMKGDSYETSAKKLDAHESEQVSYIKALDEIEHFGWFFSYPDPESNMRSFKELNKTNFSKILKIILMTLDPSVQEVKKAKDIEEAYVITLNNHDLIMKDEAIINGDILSSGTKAGIDIAIMLTSMISKLHGFYYCDEKFSYLHSDLEKEILAIMIEHLGVDDQLFFTTHNTDILDMMFPKHTFVFLKKEQFVGLPKIICVNADSYLKRNTDSLRNAIENDLLSIAPNVTILNTLSELLSEKRGD